MIISIHKKYIDIQHIQTLNRKMLSRSGTLTHKFLIGAFIGVISTVIYPIIIYPMMYPEYYRKFIFFRYIS